MLSILLTGKEINEYLGTNLNKQLNGMLNEVENYSIFENGVITSNLNNQEVAKLLIRYNETLEKLFKKLLEEHFKEIGICVRISAMNQYNDGYFWENIEEYSNDKDINISEKEMVEIYIDKMIHIKDNFYNFPSTEEIKIWIKNEWVSDSKYLPKKMSISYLEIKVTGIIDQNDLLQVKKKQKNKNNNLELEILK